MSLEFETIYEFKRDAVSPPVSSATPTFIVKANEVEVWVGWNDGKISALSSLNLDYTLDQAYYFDNQTVRLTSQLFGDVRTGMQNATKLGDIMYVLYTTSPNIVGYNIHTKAQVGAFDFPAGFTKGSDLVAANGALWIANAATNANMQNTLLKYDLTASTWSVFAIPLRHQTDQRMLINGLDGSLWVTCKNNHSIADFDLATNSFLQTYKISRSPATLSVNQNKELFVGCDVSVIKWDQAANTPTTFSANLGHTTYLDDLRTGFIWLVGGGQPTYRMIKSTVGVVAAGVTGAQTDDSIRAVAVLTNQVTYDKYDPITDTTSSITVRPHLFIRTATGVIAYRATALKGVNSSQILGTGMIAIGAQGYYGG